MKLRVQIIFVSAILALLYFLFPLQSEPPSEESIIFFPIDPNIRFHKTKTVLSLQSKKINTHYTLRWNVVSSLDRKAYLRQDISLLFGNGRLKGNISKWRESSQTILQERDIHLRDSQLYQTISFHYGEIHDNNSIKSSQKMSTDQLYVVDSAFYPLTAFREARTREEREWKKVLTDTTKEFLDYKRKQLIKYYSIYERNYYSFYLTDLVVYNERPLPNISVVETQKMIGNLWEGLYKNYFLGIKKEDGTIMSPIESTMPVILISKDYSHLLVLFETQNGTKIKLVQQIFQ